MKDFLIAIFAPSVWMQLYPYSAEWDRQFRRLMQSHRFQRADNCTAFIGGVEIWIANYPYASMRPRHLDIRPKRATILAAYEKLVRDITNPESDPAP